MKMHITKEWLKNKIKKGEEECCEAGISPDQLIADVLKDYEKIIASKEAKEKV